MNPSPSTAGASPPPPPVLAVVDRDGVVEAEHRGHLVVADTDGQVLAAVGDPDVAVYIRSAAKPFQALAVLELLGRAGATLDPAGLAIACSSHTGSDAHQVEAARLLAVAGLDESCLACPADHPTDPPTRSRQAQPSRLAHNCSGKHAAFLWAHSTVGGDPGAYLSRETLLQRRVRDHLRRVGGADPAGPGVDGCGAPAWRLPLAALATAFARLAAAAGDGPDDLRRVRTAMTSMPHLVGGAGAVDTALMLADPRVVAKRGAEGILGAGVLLSRGGLGVAVKVSDGAARATGPVVGTVLGNHGLEVPASVQAGPVYGGEDVRGHVSATAAVSRLVVAGGPDRG